jgi:hypothetical protein
MIEKEIFDGGVKLQKVPKIKDATEAKLLELRELQHQEENLKKKVPRTPGIESQLVKLKLKIEDFKDFRDKENLMAKPVEGQSRSCCGMCRRTVRLVKIHYSCSLSVSSARLLRSMFLTLPPLLPFGQVHASDSTMMATPRLSARNGGEARVQGGGEEYDYMLVRLTQKVSWFARLLALCKKKLEEEEEEEEEEAQAQAQEVEEEDEDDAEDDKAQELEDQEDDEENEEGEDEEDEGGSASAGADPRRPVVRTCHGTLSVGAEFLW